MDWRTVAEITLSIILAALALDVLDHLRGRRGPSSGPPRSLA